MAAYKGPLDYIDVATRIVEFREKYPNGSLQQQDIQFVNVAGKDWVVFTAAAYRTPDDLRPGIGTAWEPIPGPTQFTRDSEVQNAETAAWGRAMVAALAVDTKKGIASSEEIRNRQASATPETAGATPDTSAVIPAGFMLKITKADSLDVLSGLWSEAVAGGWSASVNEAVTARKKVLQA